MSSTVEDRLQVEAFAHAATRAAHRVLLQERMRPLLEDARDALATGHLDVASERIASLLRMLRAEERRG